MKAREFYLQALLVLGGIVCLFPFIWMLSLSFKPESEIYTPGFNLLPVEWDFANYAEALGYGPPDSFSGEAGNFVANGVMVDAVNFIFSIRGIHSRRLYSCDQTVQIERSLVRLGPRCIAHPAPRNSHPRLLDVGQSWPPQHFAGARHTFYRQRLWHLPLSPELQDYPPAIFWTQRGWMAPANLPFSGRSWSRWPCRPWPLSGFFQLWFTGTTFSGHCSSFTTWKKPRPLLASPSSHPMKAATTSAR